MTNCLLVMELLMRSAAKRKYVAEANSPARFASKIIVTLKVPSRMLIAVQPGTAIWRVGVVSLAVCGGGTHAWSENLHPPRLGVADHPLDRREPLAQCPLHL